MRPIPGARRGGTLASMNTFLIATGFGLAVLIVLVVVLRPRATAHGMTAAPMPSSVLLDPISLDGVLAALLERDTGAFVIIEHEGSRDFVQFSGSVDEPLTLDLPLASLHESKAAVARQTLSAMPGFSEHDVAFNAVFGRDTRAAAEAAVHVLRTVHGLQPGERLRVQHD